MLKSFPCVSRMVHHPKNIHPTWHNCGKHWSQHGPASPWNTFDTLKSPCHNELRLFWGQKRVQLNIRKVFLMFAILSVHYQVKPINKWYVEQICMWLLYTTILLLWLFQHATEKLESCNTFYYPWKKWSVIQSQLQTANWLKQLWTSLFIWAQVFLFQTHTIPSLNG